MEQGKSVTNLQRTRKHTCLKSMGDPLELNCSPEQRFEEMVRQMGRQNMNVLEAGLDGRRTKSELSLAKKSLIDDFTITEILPGDAKQIYLNESDAKSEEFVL